MRRYVRARHGGLENVMVPRYRAGHGVMRILKVPATEATSMITGS